jgi:hypothetical protein
MSSIPNAQLEGLLAGGQLLGQAQQNQATTFQAEAQRRAAGLEARGQNLQNTMQQRELAAQAENYRRLNASRERMQKDEMAQQQRQFEQSQAQEKELKLFDQEMVLAIGKAKAQAAAKAAEILGGQKDDPTLQALRQERRAMQERALNLERALNATRSGLDIARGVRSDRLDQASAQITSMHQGLITSKTNAQDAMSKGLTDLSLELAREKGFLPDVFRTLGVPGMMNVATQGIAGGGGFTVGAAALQVLAENIVDSAFGFANEDAVKARLTSTEQSPTAFAAKVVENAFAQYDDALGIKGDKKEAAKATMIGLIGVAAVLSNGEQDITGIPKGEVQAQLRQKIAQKIGDLRSYGMHDVQILGMLEGLDSIGENASRGILDSGLAATGLEGEMGKVLQQTMRGVGDIADAVQATILDSEIMKQFAGGEMTDLAKFDMPGVFRMAQQAYGQELISPQIEQFRGELNRLGFRKPEELESVIKALVENDPELQRLGFQLDPQLIAQQVLELERQQSQGALNLGALSETEQLAVQQFGARAGEAGARFELDALDQLLNETRGMRGG